MSKEYDMQVGNCIDDSDYCDVCGCDLVTSSEKERGRCSDCIEKENN